MVEKIITEEKDLGGRKRKRCLKRSKDALGGDDKESTLLPFVQNMICSISQRASVSILKM